MPYSAIVNHVFAGSGLTALDALDTMRSMIETISFTFGLGFSLFVYFRSIRPLDQSRTKKTFYFLFTLIGITGMLFLSGVLIAHFLRKLGFSV
jgi:Na+-transporting NADH:ubiquinone oxidoreductase subunit NqrB